MISEQNPQAKTASQFNIHVPQMCSNLNYVIVFPYSYNQIGKQKNCDSPIVMLTFSSQLTTIEELIQQYKKRRPEFKDEGIRFSLSKGFIPHPEWTIKKFKKVLRKDYQDSLDGLAFFIEVQQKNSAYFDQCCIASYIDQQPEFGKSPQQIRIHFSLPSKSQVIVSVTTGSTEKTEDVIKKFIKEAKQQTGVNIKQEQIQQFRISSKVDSILQKNINFEENDIYSEDLIEVVFKNKNIKFGNDAPYIKNKDLIIIYKSQGGLSTQRKLNYEIVKNMQFFHVCKQYFGIKDHQNRKENQICLRIMDLIIKPNDTLWKAWRYFQGKVDDFITIVGHIVNQRQIFNTVITDLSEKNDAAITYKQIEPAPQKRKQIQTRLKKRAVDLVDDQHFQNIQNLQPIFLYTTQAKVPKQDKTIYCSVNEHLRTKSVLNIKPQKISDDWKLRFASTLIKNLKKIKRKTNKAQKYFRTVYRGVDYRPTQKVNEIITFKSFLSTSADKNVALGVAQFNSKKNEEQKVIGQGFSLFIMTIKDGRSISSYSDVSNENEILLLPYTQFKVTKIEEKGKFKYYYLEQFGDRNQSLKEVKGNFLLWIDDKTYQGKQIYEQIQKMEEPLIFKQFQSTKEFSDWLDKNKSLLNDPTANILLISNMKRTQNGVQNAIAGVQSLKLLKEINNKIPVIFYVGYIPATIGHLQNNGLMKCGIDIKVCNDKFQLELHIKKHIKSMKFVGQIDQIPKMNKSNSNIQDLSQPVLKSQKSTPVESSNKSSFCEIQ